MERKLTSKENEPAYFLLSEIQYQFERAAEADQKRVNSWKTKQTEDSCAYLGCGRIGLRDRGRIKWLAPKYASELSIYKLLMSFPAPFRGGWQWQQGVKCEDVEDWATIKVRTE